MTPNDEYVIQLKIANTFDTWPNKYLANDKYLSVHLTPCDEYVVHLNNNLYVWHLTMRI